MRKLNDIDQSINPSVSQSNNQKRVCQAYIDPSQPCNTKSQENTAKT